MGVTRYAPMTRMPRRESARGAYCWAVRTIIARREGRGQSYDWDSGGNDGVPKDYAILDAIDIYRVSEDHDIIDSRGSWFFLDNFSDPSEPWSWSEGEQFRLKAAYKRYGRALGRKNLIE